MSQRIERLRQKVLPRTYPVRTQMARLFTESCKETEDQPEVIRTAKSQANVLDNIAIFIEDDELLVGNGASEPMAVEVCVNTIWSKESIDGLRQEGWEISLEDEAEIEKLNEYWRSKNRSTTILDVLDEDRLWPFAQAGWILPPWKSRSEAGAQGVAYSGISQFSGIGHSPDYMSVPFDTVISKGLNRIIADAEDELSHLTFESPGSLKKYHFLQATILAHKAVIRWTNRYAALAEEMAAREKDPIRKKELERIAETCRRVPANPPRSFYEAVQSFWFLFLLLAPIGSMPLMRFDQYMYPYYEKDIREGKTNEEEVLELLQCLRLKDMQLFGIPASIHRKKASGIAKWHNMTIGGQTRDGRDATNELTYLILEAAKRCPTPHHTITLRVHDKTPEPLLVKALDVVKTGVGMPAFAGDTSYIDYFLTRDIPIDLARDYFLIGCMDSNVPEGCATTFPMCATTVAVNLLLHKGVDPNTGKQVGPATGSLESFETFDDLMKALKQQIAHCMTLEAEMRSLDWQISSKQFPDVFYSSMFSDGLKQGKSGYDRPLPYRLGPAMSPVGMINIADSMAAVKSLVFDQKKVTMQELRLALKANWEGERNQEIRKMCLAAPKFGNDDDYVDLIANDLYQFFADTATKLDTPRGGKYTVGAISITAHQPAGALTVATPDGRYAGEILADASLSPGQGRDTHGPTSVIKSAAKVDQTRYQSTLMNMKFHPSALQSTEDLVKLSHLIRAYFSLGGKHIQFNVVSRETLLDAQSHPEKHRDLTVRIAGYSAYFIQLTKLVQDEIIARTELSVVA